jgi:hypothetical protein
MGRGRRVSRDSAMTAGGPSDGAEKWEGLKHPPLQRQRRRHDRRTIARMLGLE